MSDINTITISGRLGKDPEIKYFESGAAKCDISIAVNRWSKKEEKELTSWFDVLIWGKRAEYIAEYANIGDMVFLIGSLQKDVYKDQNGKQCARIYILAEDVKIAPKKAG